MAPDLTSRQTGTMPKNKPRNSGSQSHRLADEPYFQLCCSDQEQMSDIGSKNSTRKKRSVSRSETEADCLRHELERSRSSALTFQNENGEGCSQDNLCNKANIPDQKHVASKLGQIQKYIQQTAVLMNSLKANDSPSAKIQLEKFSLILEDLKDSEFKLSSLLNKMDSTKSKMDSLLINIGEAQGNSNLEADDVDLARRSEESKKKLEVLQQRKQELLKLQEKAKRQLKEAQAEQSRLVARASSLNQELGASKAADLNFQQLSQRLKAVQQMYNTTNQIANTLNENSTKNPDESNHLEEDQIETSDTETDFQVVSDKMEKLNAMKAQLSQIQKMMAQISRADVEETSCGRESGDYFREVNSNSQDSSCIDEEQNAVDACNNAMKLEQARSKLNQLTQLLEIVQSAQNSTGLSSSSIQLVSNLINEETASSTQSCSPISPDKSTQKNREEISIQTMQSMTKELEETTAAMKEERDRLLAARQEFQDMAKRLPVKSEPESLSPDDDSESEPSRLKPAAQESATRSVEAEKSPNFSDGSLYVTRSPHSRSKQRETWESSMLGSSAVDQERRPRNDIHSRGSNQSSCRASRTNSRNFGKENGRWTSSPSVSYCNERQHAMVETQNQLDICGNLCEIMLSESLQRGTRSSDISLQEMFNQHQQLTRTVAQCTQLLWLQQKQIVELRNAIMFQYGSLNAQPHTLGANQNHLNGPPVFNPFSSAFTIVNQVPASSAQQHQNFLHGANPNAKLNMKRPVDLQNVQPPQSEYHEQYMQQPNQAPMLFSDDFGFDVRSGNFSRFYPSVSNGNQNIQLNVNSGLNNSGPNGINSMVPEDSRALNNQVPPGNRANNYWDNFRSYSRQNLLSSTKSNEDSETSRRCTGTFSQDRLPRDPPLPPFLQNNQSVAGPSQQSLYNPGSSEVTANDQFLVIPSQNTWHGSHGQITRSRSVEPQSNRNSGKNESRLNDSDSRNLHLSSKNEGSGGARPRNTDFSSDIRSVKNDVSQSVRNLDNLNSSRNVGQLVRDVDHEETPQGNNKKRLERDRSRNEGMRNLNNRVYHNTNLWDNIYSEVSNFIRANESRPDFLHHLFSGLQLVTTDNLRQRTLLTIQEAVSGNNVLERQSNMSGGNVNCMENRKNLRENRSNLNLNQTDDLSRIDELFFHLRENQNTIRQNIGMSSCMLGGNLENPNISNIRDLGSSRNNLESEGLRDLRTYFEASLCNFGHNSTLENPNLSNIRENLTRRDAGTSDFENPRPKNVYLSIFDNAGAEQRRRSHESSSGPGFGSPYGNFGLRNDYLAHEFSGNRDNVREMNNKFEIENNYEGAVGGRLSYQDENSPTGLRLLESGDSYSQDQFVGNVNDSGIDINFNNEERKRCFTERTSDPGERPAKPKKNGNEAIENAVPLALSDWERNAGNESSFNSSTIHCRKEPATSFIPVCDNSLFNSRTFQQSDNGDLAEADQSRNEEISGAKSHCSFNTRVNLSALFVHDQDLPPLENNFASQNIPESERSFMEYNNQENDSLDGACAAGPEGNPNFPNSASEPEGNFLRATENGEDFQKDEQTEEYLYQPNPSSSSDSAQVKSGIWHGKKCDEPGAKGQFKDAKKGSCKNSTNKFRDCSAFPRGKYGEPSADNCDNPKTDSESADGRQRGESRDSFYGAFQVALEKSVEAEKGNTSAEAESGWECGSGLDQVPTRLKKKGSSKSDNSSGSIP